MSIKSNTITLDNSQIITSEEEAIMLSRDTDFKTNYNVNQSLQSNKTEQNSIKTPQKEIKKSRLEQSLDKLAKLISNVTESHTTAIFVADQHAKVLHSLAHHSLSREYIDGVTIPYGCGLVGWTAENKVRITVCPFEHDARTLLYYPNDQGLKSFIAVPILDSHNELIGVIACDSKKNYAFAKVTEKILSECAVQAQLLIELHLDNQKLQRKAPKPQLTSDLEKICEELKLAKNEEHLFNILCAVPQTMIAREAMIALVTSHEGFGEATFYTSANEHRVEHHLVDLVCKHKKVLCSERSVHVLPNDDIKARSFLSVPFHVYKREAGALNVLSAAFKGFSPSDIEALEKLAKIVGIELERLRSKTVINSRQIGPSLLPWRHFVHQADMLTGLHKESTLRESTLRESTLRESTFGKSPLQQYCLLRIQLQDLFSLEQSLGVKNVAEIHEQILRFVQQLAAHPMIASSPYGTSTYIIGENAQIDNLIKRLSNVISKIPYMENLDFLERLPDNASEIIAKHLELRKIEFRTGIASISDVIHNPTAYATKVEVTHVEAKKPTAAQIPQNKSQNGGQISNFTNLKNTFDQRLSQALRTQEEQKANAKSSQNMSSEANEESFTLGNNQEQKEVANARFW